MAPLHHAITQPWPSILLFELERLVTAHERAGAAPTGGSIGPAVLAFIHNLKLEATAFTRVNLALLHLVTVRHSQPSSLRLVPDHVQIHLSPLHSMMIEMRGGRAGAI